jgi:hypothetical protein
LSFGGIVPDPEGVITSGHGNTTARSISFRQGDINARPLTPTLVRATANNRAGGPRKPRPL